MWNSVRLVKNLNPYSDVPYTMQEYERIWRRSPYREESWRLYLLSLRLGTANSIFGQYMCRSIFKDNPTVKNDLR